MRRTIKNNPRGRIVGYIYETKNYEIFQPLEGNRDIDERRKNDVKKSINEHGQLQPIQVNEKNAIMDGQARLEALKELDLPVQYYVKTGFGLTECIEMNNTGKKWPTMAYIDSIIVRNETSPDVKHDYEMLKECLETYKKQGLNESIIIKICAQDWGGGSVVAKVKHGEFRFKRPPEIATNLLNFLSQFSYILKRCGRKELVIPALVEVYENEAVDNMKFVTRCIVNQNMLHGVASLNEARVMFEDAYNYRLPVHKRISLIRQEPVATEKGA